MKRAVLVVLDGFGERRESDGNAIRLARTPNFDWLYRARHGVDEAMRLPNALLEFRNEQK